MKIRIVKPEIRILGLDEGKRSAYKLRKSHIFGVIYRGGRWLDGVLKTSVEVDRTDVSREIVKLVKHSGHYGQIRVIMLGRIFFAGRNPVDPEYIFKKLKRPIMVLAEKRVSLEGLGELKSLRIHGNQHLRFYLYGLSKEEAEEILKVSILSGQLPEPIRVARLIASAFQSAYEKLQNL